MNVLQVIGAPCRQAGSFERHLIRLAELGAARGMRLVACYPSEPAALDVLRAAGIEVLVRPVRGKLDASFANWVRSFGRSRGVGLVHGHFEPASFLAAFGARAAFVPAVLTRHYLASNPPRSLHALQTRASARAARMTIAVSEPVRASLLGLGVPASRVRTLPLGVDRARHAPPSGAQRNAARAAFGLGRDETAVLSTSHHRPGKGVDVLVDAAVKLGGGVTVLVAGDGPMTPELRRAAAERGLPVRFLGRVPDVRALLRAADVFVLPTDGYPEGLPMAAVEAMASGLPVVSTPVPAMAPLLRDAGVTVAAGDPGELARALNELAADAAARERLGAAARERTEPFDLDRCAGAVLDLYEEVARR